MGTFADFVNAGFQLVLQDGNHLRGIGRFLPIIPSAENAKGGSQEKCYHCNQQNSHNRYPSARRDNLNQSLNRGNNGFYGCNYSFYRNFRGLYRRFCRCFCSMGGAGGGFDRGLCGFGGGLYAPLGCLNSGLYPFDCPLCGLNGFFRVVNRLCRITSWLGDTMAGNVLGLSPAKLTHGGGLSPICGNIWIPRR